MSIEPPKSESHRGIPGMVIPLAFISVILLAAVLVFGALAFDVNIPGVDREEPETIAPEEALEATGFTLRERSVENETTVVSVEVRVLNASEEAVGDFQIIVQCTDNGYVSAIADASGLGSGESRTIAMQLSGRGEPSCDAPVVEFAAEAP